MRYDFADSQRAAIKGSSKGSSWNLLQNRLQSPASTKSKGGDTPSPLVGEDWGGGSRRPIIARSETRICKVGETPHPSLPPQGGKENALDLTDARH